MCPKMGEDGRNIYSTRQHATAYDRRGGTSWSRAAESVGIADSQGLISELVDDECMQDGNHQTMGAFFQTIMGFGLGQARHPQELDTF